nr:hypothetical protein [Tanacetum cinerariifolium]
MWLACERIQEIQRFERIEIRVVKIISPYENGVALDEEQFLFITVGQDNVDDDVDEQPLQDLALNVDNVFHANECDAFDSDVDEASTTHTMFMANLSSAYPVYDKAGPSYNSDILPEYVKDNAGSAVQNTVSSVPHDASLLIINEMHEQTAQKQVERYERRAKFELTEREQKIEKQLRIVITDRNIKEENLKKELHSVKMQLNYTINHNKSMTPPLRPIKALMVYPLNTLATLVSRVLPTKSQVKINIFALLQLFLDFEKTCKKIITPTGLTEGERGFEQTKTCYFTEVIPFLNTIKENFERIQKALINEIKEIKEVFDQIEAEVDQHAVDKKCNEIEWKNLLTENKKLIAECLSKEMFFTATNSELTVSRFNEIHDAHTVVQARCLKLEEELSKLNDKIQKDDHNELVKCFS